MRFSRFARRFSRTAGIVQLMDDLGRALGAGERILMLGGGNPSHIPEVQARLRECMVEILDTPGQFERMIGDYDPPQGCEEFLAALAELLRREQGWGVEVKNIAIVNGSQTAFFDLFNMFGGELEDGGRRKILLPVAPEYIGYEDVGLNDDLFVARRPAIEFLGDRLFKYHVNFDTLTVTEEIGAICVSRPTNPTGNVLTDEEIGQLSELAAARDVPLIIDSAYGMPFPGIVFSPATPVWNEHIILCLSLSKLGLPAVRTGIVVAHEEVIETISGMNAVMNLAPGGLGARLALQLVRSGEIVRLSNEVIRPFYQEKADRAVAWLREELGGVSFHIHKPEGAFFLWLWLEGLSITSFELYQRLKGRGVVVVPGEFFFPGLDEDWSHRHECLRISYVQPDSVVQAGMRVIGEEVRRA
jgi:valine--pyruvate aminotransferase